MCFVVFIQYCICLKAVHQLENSEYMLYEHFSDLCQYHLFYSEVGLAEQKT